MTCGNQSPIMVLEEGRQRIYCRMPQKITNVVFLYVLKNRRDPPPSYWLIQLPVGGSNYVRYSTLLLLPPLRFNCVGGSWDRTQDSCDNDIGCQTHALTTRLDLIHNWLDLFHTWLDLIHTLMKQKLKFSSYIRKFRVEQLQSHI
jgi:hypothetical protein